MKRHLAVLLAALMLLCMLPTSMFSVTAATVNSSVATETITVDRSLSDSGWRSNGWITVTPENGYWQTLPTTNDTISYKYQFRTDDTKLYGAFIIDSKLVVGGNGTGTNVRIWFRTNENATVYTHFYDLNASAFTAKKNTSTTTNSATNIENSSLDGEVYAKNGKTYVEFSLNLAEFGGKNGFDYFAVVSNKVNENVALYYPPVPVPANSDRNANLPFTKWYTRGDITINPKDIALGQIVVDHIPEPEVSETYMVPEYIAVDGMLNENGWKYNGWTSVDSDNGYWEALPTTDDLSYKYQFRTYNGKLYGAFIIDCPLVVGERGSGTNARIWIKTKDNASVFTHYYDLNAQRPIAMRNLSTTSEVMTTISNSSLITKVNGIGDKTYIEFSVELDDFQGEDGFEYYVNVSNKDIENVSLYHPAVPVGANGSRLDNLPFKKWNTANDATLDVDALALGEIGFAAQFKNLVGATNKDSKFDLVIDAPAEYNKGDDITVKVSVENITAKDGLDNVNFSLFYDNSKLVLTNSVEQSNYGALECVDLPKNWENFSVANDNGSIDVAALTTTLYMASVTEDGDLVFEFNFTAEDDATGDIGVYIPNATVWGGYNEANGLTAFAGNAAYAIIDDGIPSDEDTSSDDTSSDDTSSDDTSSDDDSEETVNVLCDKDFILSGCGYRDSYRANVADGIADYGALDNNRESKWFAFYYHEDAAASAVNAPNGVGYVIFDLGGIYKIDEVRTNLINRTDWGIHAPKAVNVYISDDGINWGKPIGSMKVKTIENMSYWAGITGEWETRYLKVEYVLDGVFVFTNEIEAYGTAHKHDDGEWHIVKEAEPGVEGLKELRCTVCDELIDSVTIPALHKHDDGEWYIVKDAEPGVEGLKELRCTSCGEVLDSEIIPALHKHDDGEWHIVKDAEPGVEGLKELRCTSCGEVLDSEIIPALHKHDDGEWYIVKDAEPGVEGLKELRCTSCGEVLDSEIIPALHEHAYNLVDGKLVCECDEVSDYSGLYYDEASDTYYYAESGVLVSGWKEIDNSWHYFTSETKAAATGNFKVNGVEFNFDETGKTEGTWANTPFGKRYYYGPDYYRLGWQTIDGDQYFFDNGYPVEGIRNLASYENGIRTWYSFDENGALVGTLNGIYELDGTYRYLENGVGVEKGLIKVDGDYYFAASAGELVVNKTQYAWLTNCDLPIGKYTFGADGKMLGVKAGGEVVKVGDNYYYYENGVGVEKGLVKVGDDYYYSVYMGELVVNKVKYAVETSCDLPAGRYEFGPDGKMLKGIVEKDGKYYYYENGNGAEKGLVKVGDDYYFAVYMGELIVNKVHYAWQTNCDLPAGKYEFGADGKMLNGIVEKDGKYYYYENGNGAEKGLVKVGEDYYFAASAGELVVNKEKYAAQTSCDLPVGRYEFGPDGKMLNGIVEKNGEYYYYENGMGAEKGLIYVDGYYYFSQYGGKLITNRDFYVWNANGLIIETTYTFDEYGRIVG